MEPQLSTDFSARVRRVFRKIKRKWLWRQVPCLLVILLYLFSLSLVKVVKPDPHFVNYEPVRASNDLFVTVASYLIDGDAAERLKGPYKSSEDEVLLVFLGIGEFGASAQNASDDWKKLAPSVPTDLQCAVVLPGNHIEVFGNAYAHVTGTAFENSISSHGRVRYFGERALMLSCAVPKSIQQNLYHGIEQGFLPEHGEVALRPVKILNDKFDTGLSTPTWFLSQKVPIRMRETNVLCSTPIYGLSGARWLTEWLFFHHFIQGFDHVHLYFLMDIGQKTMKTIVYLTENYPWITAHNWTSVVDGGERGMDPTKGVGNDVVTSVGFERAQRLARTDCFLRNRGHKWIGFADVDEFFYTAPGSSLKKNILPLCETKPMCRFSSVTVYPVKSGNSKMFLESLSPICEGSCIQGFNCGIFNYGREKYLLKASRDTPNPGTILAIHTVSDSHPFSETFGHTLVPKKLGYIKHYNPAPYKDTGGYPEKSPGVDCPFSDETFATIRSAIENDSVLKVMYDRDHAEEQFLMLERADDPWRFKPKEHVQ